MSGKATNTPKGGPELQRRTSVPAGQQQRGGNLEVIEKAVKLYWSQTAGKLKAIDAFLAYVMLTGIIQFVYCVIVGPYPFNSFLAGFLSCIGTFVLTVALRMQATDNGNFKESPPKRAFADFLLCNAILHLWVMNFMG